MPEVIERNGVTKELVEFEIVKGDRKGLKYLAPKVDISSPESWANEVTWGELKNIANCWQTFLKRVFQDVWFGCFTEDGQQPGYTDDGKPNTLMAKFLEKCKDFSAAGMKLKEIDRLIDETQTILGRRVETASGEDFADADWQHETKELNQYILLLKSMRADRERSRAADKTAEEDAAPAVAVR